MCWRSAPAPAPRPLCNILSLLEFSREPGWGHGLGCSPGHSAVSLQLKSKWDESIFTKGCIQALEGWLPRNIYIVAGVFIAISLLQVCSGNAEDWEGGHGPSEGVGPLT